MVEKRPTGERTLDTYSRLLSDRIVYLGTELDDGVANMICVRLFCRDYAASGMTPLA